jgi:large subunit ribosomal protein L4
MNKKERRLALLSLLSSKAKGLQIKVIDLIDLKEIKTKNISTIFTNMKLDSTLFSILPDNKNLFLISRNISNVKPILV